MARHGAPGESGVDRIGTPPAGKVEANGLHLPPALRKRVTDALRALYPHLTEGKSDPQARAAVIAQWFADALVQYEANAKLPNVTEIVEKAREEAMRASREAEAKARKDAEEIAPDPTQEDS